MGRFESLTALALGRTPYESIVLHIPSYNPAKNIPSSNQQYNEHGHPRNPETRRREREHIRAANEVLQVTGVVEDAQTARYLAEKNREEKKQDTLLGMRYIEYGCAMFVGCVWGVMGLKRRILLYKPYSQYGFLGLIKHEKSIRSLPSLLFSGLPAIVAYRLLTWVEFFAEEGMDRFFDRNQGLSPRKLWWKRSIQKGLDSGFKWVLIMLEMFAILQHVNMIPSSRLLPSLGCFIPFSKTCPVQLPPLPEWTRKSVSSFAYSLWDTAKLPVIVYLHGRVKLFVGKLAYRPIYKILPRPLGDSMFKGVSQETPALGWDSPDADRERTSGNGHAPAEDEPTLRVLEGLPQLERTIERALSTDHESSDNESEGDGGERPTETLLSFEYESTDAVMSSNVQYAATLRSPEQPRPSSDGVAYRITGITLLPPILLTEGVRDIIAGFFILPLEATMVRVLASAYRRSAGLGTSDLYRFGDRYVMCQIAGKMFSVFAVQFIVTGFIWAGFIHGVDWVTARRKKKDEEQLETTKMEGADILTMQEDTMSGQYSE